MGIEDIFVWYQKKIASYDKQQWETKIEKSEIKTLGYLNSGYVRRAKPDTNLIDLDLIRGSSFTKAKPQHGFITVAKLATVRILFLPIFTKWWTQQTSKALSIIITILYISQIINLILYFGWSTSNDTQNISFMEMVIPFTMMWIISLIHSQIMATNSEFGSPKPNHKQYKCRRTAFRRQRSRESIIEKKSDIFPRNRGRIKKLQFNDVVQVKSVESETNRSNLNSRINLNGDDDGFESLNGNGSRTSDEEVISKKDSNVDIYSKFKWTKDELFKSKSHSSSDSDKDSIITLQSLNRPSVSSESESADGESAASPKETFTRKRYFHMREWSGVTTNSEEGSYSSDMEDVSDYKPYENDSAPADILNPPSGVKVSCSIMYGNELKKVDLSVIDISSAIIGKVDSMPKSMDYFYIGLLFSTLLSFLPIICRFCSYNGDPTAISNNQSIFDLYRNITTFDFYEIDFKILETLGEYFSEYVTTAFGTSALERVILISTFFQRWILSAMIFFLLAVAERTFKQRLLSAKLFSHLTSSRRARNSNLPHFRLNKVRNIKTWLSVRSYLKKRGPQRSVDIIVSTAFVICLLLLTFLCVEMLKETINLSQYYLEALVWCLGLGVMLLRFMTLGTKINEKYRNMSVLITEQINLHLQIEQKPWKKDKLNVANSVLKLAADLLKELDSPFKISGLSANPILYNITKLVILSALSGVLSEMLGFKLKLHKIKLK